MTEPAAPGFPASRAPAASRWGWPALVALGLAYVFSGRLSLMLAIPPGYASAIFPPAGIAVAAVLAGGLRTLPWIFAGSLALNLWVGIGGGLEGRVVAAGFVIAIASSLQALVGGAALRRWLGLPTPMDDERALLRFLLLIPLVCTVSASLSVGGLALLGMVAAGDGASSWFTWWIGDTLGVLVMLPLTMVLVGEPRTLWRSRASALFAPILIGFVLFVAIFVRFSAWEQEESLLEFKLLSREAVERLDTSLDAQEALLEQTERLFGSSDYVTRAEFSRYTTKALQRYPMIRAIEWAPRVPAAARRAFEQRESVEIREPLPQSQKLVRAGPRDEYFPITYIEPYSGNEAAHGLDIAVRISRAMLARASASGRATVSAPVVLVQDLTQGRNVLGAVIVLPVASGNNGDGYVASVLRMQDYIGGIVAFTQPQLYLRVDDVGAGKTIYSNLPAGAGATLFEATLDFGGRQYRLQSMPTPAYLHAHHGWQSWGMLVAGLLFIGLLSSALLLSTGHTARIEAEVAERTAALHDEKAFTEAVVRSLPGMFYILDDQRRIVRWNHNLTAVFGVNEQALHDGGVLSIAPEEDRELARAAIERVYRTKGYEEIELRLQASGTPPRRFLVNGQYVEIAGRGYLIGTGVDITERREMEQEVQRGRKVLRTLIDAAPVWLTMVERGGRMLIANRRFGETFGLPQRFIEGKHYSAVFPPENSVRMESMLEASFSGREIEFSDEWHISGLPTLHVHGKCVPVMDGETVVSVVIAIMDITEVHHVQSSLRTANAALERRVEEIRKLQALLQEQAIRDPLTGLFNRRYLDETLEVELIKAQRAGYPVSIVMGDIDRFKKLNDTYGHQAGDQVIRMLADLLREHARASDILCRYGGEEFLLVMPQMSPRDAAARMDAVRLAFGERRITFGAFELAATISFGISAYPDDGKVADRLIAAADRALYEAKANGRNRVELARA